MTSIARRYLTFTALVIVSYSLPSPAEAQVVPGSWLSVRSGPAFIQLEPHPQGGVVAELQQATLVQASQFRDGWYYVRLPRRASEPADRWGWIVAASVLPSAPPPVVRPAPSETTAPQSVRENTPSDRSWWDKVKHALNPVNWFK